MCVNVSNLYFEIVSCDKWWFWKIEMIVMLMDGIIVDFVLWNDEICEIGSGWVGEYEIMSWD